MTVDTSPTTTPSPAEQVMALAKQWSAGSLEYENLVARTSMTGQADGQADSQRPQRDGEWKAESQSDEKV